LLLVVVYYLCSAKTKDMVKDNDISQSKGEKRLNEVKFNLKSIKDRNKLTLISSVFRYGNGNKIVYSTQHKIKPLHWNAKKQRPISSYEFYNELKKELDKVEKEILSIHNQLGSISEDEFKHKLNANLGRVEVEAPGIDQKGFIQILRKRIDENKNEGSKKKLRTGQKLESLLNRILEFTNKEVTFETFTLDWQKNFIKWRYDHTRAKSQNTINKDFETIASILREGYQNELHNNRIFEKKEFKVKRVETSDYALNESDLQKLFDFDFSQNKRLERVRDWFLIACYTSLRWSDFSVMKPEHFKFEGDRTFISKFTEKTNTNILIPINKKCIPLLEKYNYQWIGISEQKFNDYIKEAAKEAELLEKIILRENFKGKPIDVEYQKYEVISSHSGRRTWATINYKKGIPIALLMQVTGHQKESTFKGYVNATNEDYAMALSELMDKEGM
jgi:integrase